MVLSFSLSSGVAAQAADDSLVVRNRMGAQVLLTNSGFGIGAFLSRSLPGERTFVLDLSLGATKDEREVAFFDRFGQRDVPNKANFLIEIPIQFGIERRLFRSSIEDNFRPFVQASTGPVLGWVYPYFDDENGNGTFDEDESTSDVLSGITDGHFETGIGASFSIGARFGEEDVSGIGVRIGYRLSYYRDEIALLEASIKPPTRRIGTPLIVLYFGSIRL